MKGDEAFAKRKAGLQKNELNEQLKDYINQWRDERSKEEEELKRLKEKQAKRKEIRAEQEKELARKKREEEELVRKAEAERKAEEAEKKKSGKSQAPAMDARKELSKSKEQVEEECRISLNIRLKPLQLDAMDSDELKAKAKRIWESIVTLETDKYDYEQRKLDQDYELKELKERQKLQMRNKAVKKGLDPEAFTGAHPPRIHVFSKYERRTDTRTYVERKKLYEGGAEVLRAEMLEQLWKDKNTDWMKRAKSRLPKWFGERPGKKPGDPDTPEGEEGGADEAAEEEYDEEEDEDYEEEEEEE